MGFNEKCVALVDQINKDIREGKTVTVASVRETFNEKHLNLKRAKIKRGKKKVEVSDNSSEDGNEESDKALNSRSIAENAMMQSKTAYMPPEGCALVATGGQWNNNYGGFTKQFKGKCNYCGGWGHKKFECKEHLENFGDENWRKCEHCQKDTHASDMCWDQ